MPQVGDFVAVGETLYHLYGGAAATDERVLREAAVLGPERTLEQDATFAFRILVDIATKALSKAINDPTTAVLVIDQLLLRLVSKRGLGNETMADATGKLRVIIRTPNWDDYVHLAFVEIRHCGAESMQVVRRLRAMGENLLTVLPEHRHPPCGGNSTCSTARWRRSILPPRTWRSPAPATRRDWAERRSRSADLGRYSSGRSRR